MSLESWKEQNSTDWDVIVLNDINNAVADVFQMPFKVDERGHRSSAALGPNSASNAGVPLTVRFDSLVTRIILDNNLRATGVEYLEGEILYRADPRVKVYGSDANSGIPRTVFASREVIIAGGAFNSPQVLLNSGIGPAEELQKHNITVRLDLKGVGKN